MPVTKDTPDRESHADQVSRVEQMVKDDGGTWDLSDNDKAALQAVLDDRAALLGALQRAVATIRSWHGMGMGNREAQAWELYQASPEMTQINAALALAEGR